MKRFLFLALGAIVGCGPCHAGVLQACDFPGYSSAYPSPVPDHRARRGTADCIDDSQLIGESQLWTVYMQDPPFEIGSPSDGKFVSLDVTDDLSAPMLVKWAGDPGKSRFIEPFTEQSWNITPSSTVSIQQTLDNLAYGSGVQFDGIVCQ